jgi:hypothetical protein
MEASGAIAPMEGIWLFLWSDALPTTRSLERIRGFTPARRPDTNRPLLSAAEAARDFNSRCIAHTGFALPQKLTLS